ncbi:site-specific integrase [Variibacter gotjawalensis]|uniref:site-specific integrase n=1 Tax=Variibacter gotjawalensis TaxID=1333996 RepID=UPI000BBA92F8
MADYISAIASVYSGSTLRRRLAAIAKAHRLRGCLSPVSSEIVRATIQGISRTHIHSRREAAPLLKEDLVAVLDAMGSSPKDVRDRALLLLGWAGAFRRSEIVSLNVGDVVQARQGLVVTLRRSKTDQTGTGRQIGIPYGRTRHCPVNALNDWLALRGDHEGPLFYSVRRCGQMRSSQLPAATVSEIVQRRVAATGLVGGPYSGHSLRAGFITSCALAGIASWRIRNQSGHKSEAMLTRYIRRGELFTENPAAQLL